MEKIKEFFAKYWGIIVGVLGLVFYAIFQRSKRLDAEANNSVIAADVKDVDLQRRVDENNEKLSDLDTQLAEVARKEKEAKEKAQHESDQDKVDYWNKKLGDK
jgi:hypothetical protein